MIDKLQRLLDDKTNPAWCNLLEVSFGEIANKLNDIGDYELAEKYHPNIFAFTEDDFMASTDATKIPKDWLAFVGACMEKYEIEP